MEFFVIIVHCPTLHNLIFVHPFHFRYFIAIEGGERARQEEVAGQDEETGGGRKELKLRRRNPMRNAKMEKNDGWLMNIFQAIIRKS